MRSGHQPYSFSVPQKAMECHSQNPQYLFYDYSENILVQESTGNLLRDELGWDVRFAYNTEVLGKNGTFGRESYKEILLLRYFHEALTTVFFFSSTKSNGMPFTKPTISVLRRYKAP